MRMTCGPRWLPCPWWLAVNGVHGALVLGGVTNQALGVVEGSVPLVVGDNLHAVILPDADTGVGSFRDRFRLQACLSWFVVESWVELGSSYGRHRRFEKLEVLPHFQRINRPQQCSVGSTLLRLSRVWMAKRIMRVMRLEVDSVFYFCDLFFHGSLDDFACVM